jgi:GTPase
VEESTIANRERQSLDVQSERTILAAVRLPDDRYDVTDPFGELRALAEQAGAVVVGELSQNLPRPVAGTYIGSGKVDELKALCESLEATTVIFDHDLSPKQISSIEERVGRKVLDRSELILDIFANRATTHEAKLQVELAQIEYTYPRLKAMWDHLERIVGGGGMTGIGTRGPGEQQLEIDRRLVQKRRLSLERQLDEIQARKRREVQARKAEHFTVGIVGYTNAGKSTLFNTLTTGGAYADNRLFATLMTRTREWNLGSSAAEPAPPKNGKATRKKPEKAEGEAGGGGGVSVMLSDTVGFVRNLPHNLVASFKATLEEATHADLLLIVLDIADPAAELHWNTVNTVLDDLFEQMKESRHEEDREVQPPPRVLLLNKADRLKDNAKVLVWQRRVPGAMPICALAGTDPARPPLGQRELVELVRSHAVGPMQEYTFTVPVRDSKSQHLIESRSTVVARDYDEESAILKVKMGRRQLDILFGSGARFTVVDGKGKPVKPPQRKVEFDKEGNPVVSPWAERR